MSSSLDDFNQDDERESFAIFNFFLLFRSFQFIVFIHTPSTNFLLQASVLVERQETFLACLLLAERQILGSRGVGVENLLSNRQVYTYYQ